MYSPRAIQFGDTDVIDFFFCSTHGFCSETKYFEYLNTNVENNNYEKIFPFISCFLFFCWAIVKR